MSNRRKTNELKKCKDVEDQIAKDQERVLKEVEELEEVIESKLKEYLDGFILIGFSVESGTPVIKEFHKTPLVFLGLNELLNRFYGNWNKEENNGEDQDDGDGWKADA